MSLTESPPAPEFPAIGEGFTIHAAEPDRGGYIIGLEDQGGERSEAWVGGHLAEQLKTVEIPAELPIIVCLREPSGQLPWRFDYLGRPDPELQLREAVGDQLDGEPYRFDPSDHMDLATAEPPAPIPPPAAPGPPVSPGAQTAPPNPVPLPSRPLGTFGDQSVPFAH
jgi:hypothetical protein